MPDQYAAKAVAAVLRDGAVRCRCSGYSRAFANAGGYFLVGNIGGGGFMLAHMDGQNHF
jgi:hypothetical protein